ncbi:MAG: hypothetical protein H7Y43_16970 [Akkermansiaceae bacterium]|nr:hypothetical protein [Verrucomicrobiales bacterium]
MKEPSQLTFETHDKLGLKPFGQKLEQFLMVEHDFVEGSLVVSLNAPFGADKTTFLTMWKSDLDKRREADNSTPQVVIINAWESDYCGDPLLSIVNALIKAANGDSPEKNTEAADKLREAAKDMGWFVVGLANNMASQWSGVDPASAGEFAEAKKQGRQPKIPDFVTLYEERTKALGKLKETLRQVLGGEQPKAFVFVDELDRCRPDYAINYLETIKHVFDIHGLVFVLAVDYGQLECSAKALFGVDLRFPDYFRKFVQRSVTLPEPDESSLHKLAHHFVTHYMEKEGKRTSLMHFDEYRIKNIVELIDALKMPPRQIQETFRIIGHVVAGDSTRGRLLWCIGVGVILMSALKVAEADIYRRIGKGDATHNEVGKFLIKLLGKEKSHWWFCLYLTGSGKHEGDDAASRAANLEKLFRDLEYVKKDEKFDAANALHGNGGGWGHNYSDRWKEIYQKIESATSF